MDDNEIKIMILKLIQTEKLLKQIFKKKKKELHKKNKKGKVHREKKRGDDVSQAGNRSVMRSRLGA